MLTHAEHSSNVFLASLSVPLGPLFERLTEKQAQNSINICLLTVNRKLTKTDSVKMGQGRDIGNILSTYKCK